MSKFQTYSNGRFFVHVLQTKKYRTRHLAIKLVQPMNRQKVTESALLPYLWMEGTTRHPSSLALMRYTDELFGSSVRTFVNKRADRHVLEVQASAPEEGTVEGADTVFRDVYQLALQLVTDPLLGDHGFPSDNVDREKGLHQKRIQSVFDDKISYAMERCMEEMCQDTPLGLPRLGYLEDLPQIHGNRLWQVQQEIANHSDVHVYVVGNIADVETFANQLLQELHQFMGQGPQNQYGTVRAFAGTRSDVKTVTEQQAIQQGKLNLGLTTGVSYGDTEYLPLFIGNGILGGFPHSKLFMNVRERNSLAYYASSRLDGLTGIIGIQTGIEVANKDKAYEIILQQVDALKQGELTDDEFDYTVKGLTNQYMQVLDQPMSLTEIHFSGVLAGIYRDVEQLLEQIRAVRKEEVVKAVQSIQLDTVYFLTAKEAGQNA